MVVGTPTHITFFNKAFFLQNQKQKRKNGEKTSKNKRKKTSKKTINKKQNTQ